MRKKLGLIIKKIKNKIKQLADVRDELGWKKMFAKLFALLAYFLFCKPLIAVLKRTARVKKNRIVFETKPDFADNGRALSDYMVQNGYHARYQIIWLVADPAEFSRFQQKNVKFVRAENPKTAKRTVAAYYYSLTAHYVFFTHSFKWVNRKPDGQIYVNLWHGCGYKASRDRKEPNTFDCCLVPGNVFIKTKSIFFDCEEDKILPIGYPRYDLLRSSNPSVTDYLSRIGAAGKKVVLWMPTFVQSKDLVYYANPIPAIIGLPLMNSIYDLDRLENICRDLDLVLIVKWHRISRSHREQMSAMEGDDAHIVFLDEEEMESSGFQLYELIGQSDALVTDYSSVAIDYMLLDKPIGFTLEHMDDYAKTRGFVFDDPTRYMPGEHLFAFNDLKLFLQHVKEGIDLGKDQRKAIMGEIHNPTDNYCKRILDYFEIL